MYFSEDLRFFSASVNILNLKPLQVACSDNPAFSESNKEEPKHKKRNWKQNIKG